MFYLLVAIYLGIGLWSAWFAQDYFRPDIGWQQELAGTTACIFVWPVYWVLHWFS